MFSDKAPKTPLISVIIVTLNAGHTLERTIQSVLSQSYKNVELIIIDGGSTDNTLALIETYKLHLAYWVSEADKGIYDAMNKGVKKANGDWVYFLGADDILVNILHRLVDNFRRNDTIYYGDVYWPAQNRVYDGEFKWHKLMNKNICHQAIFYPKEVFKQYQYNVDYTICGDYALNLKLWSDKRFKFAYIPLLICIFQDREGKSRSELDRKFEQNKLTLMRSAFSKELYWRNLYLNACGSLAKAFNLLGIAQALKQFLSK